MRFVVIQLSRLTELRGSIHVNTRVCKIEKQRNDKAHGHQHKPNKHVSDKTAKAKTVAKSKTGGSRHQLAVRKQEPQQHSKNKQSTANEEMRMKNSNRSKKVVNTTRNWVASAMLVAVMTATNVDVAL